MDSAFAVSCRAVPGKKGGIFLSCIKSFEKHTQPLLLLNTASEVLKKTLGDAALSIDYMELFNPEPRGTLRLEDGSTHDLAKEHFCLCLKNYHQQITDTEMPVTYPDAGNKTYLSH